MSRRASVPRRFLFAWAAFVLMVPTVARSDELAVRLQRALAEGRLSVRLSEPEQVRALLGPPERESEAREGGMNLLIWEYGDLSVIFGSRAGGSSPPLLLGVRLGDQMWEPEPGRMVALTDAADLARLDPLTGVRNVDLSRLDLRASGSTIEAMSFDTRTRWPGRDSLPEGFDPAAILARGRNPGLGVHALHRRGIDGRGVGIAILDQPLILPHDEYRVARLDTAGLGGFPPQMHGPAVLSAAAGRTCGVAPGAEVSYFAVPMWERGNRAYVHAMDQVLALNDTLPPGRRIRVVSISTGTFAQQADSADWRRVRERAERAGIVLVTCDGGFVRFGMLSRAPGGDPDDPASYRRGRYSAEDDELRVPGARTLAGHEGSSVYTYYPVGGLSWGAPYIAGLAALACQVRPEAGPREIAAALIATAKRTPAGPVVDPGAFIARIRR